MNPIMDFIISTHHELSTYNLQGSKWVVPRSIQNVGPTTIFNYFISNIIHYCCENKLHVPKKKNHRLSSNSESKLKQPMTRQWWYGICSFLLLMNLHSFFSTIIPFCGCWRRSHLISADALILVELILWALFLLSSKALCGVSISTSMCVCVCVCVHIYMYTYVCKSCKGQSFYTILLLIT